MDSSTTGSKINENKVCDICLKKPSSHAIPLAVMYCLNCAQNICNDCLQFHASFNGTSSHELQCLDPPSGHILCYHNNKSWFCHGHKNFCCDDCKDSVHKDCVNVLSISRILQKQDSLMEQNQKLLQKLVDMKYKVEEEVKMTQKKERDWMERLNTEVKKMNQAKEELEDQIQLKVEYVKSQMKKNREIVNKKMNDLQNAINDIEKDKAAMKNPSMDEIKKLLLINKMEENLTKIGTLLSSDTNECHIAFLKGNCAFEAQHYYQEIMIKFKETIESINKIYGEIQKHIFPSNRNEASASDSDETSLKRTDYEQTYVKMRYELDVDQTANDRAQTTPKVLQQQLLELKSGQQLERDEQVHKVKEIEIQSHCQMNVKLENDEFTCGITGISTLESGYYFMADFQNSRLKIFAPCGEYICHLDCTDKPRDISKMSGNQFLVTFPMKEIVRIVNVKGDTKGDTQSIVFVKDIPTHARCCGVAFNNERIYVATQLPHQILIMFPDGKNDRVIVGDNLFERATYIAVEPTSSMVFISDPNKMFVLGVNAQMKRKFVYKVQQPHAIACAGNECIFVTDWSWEEETIHLVNKDGIKIGHVRIQNCKCPQKLFYLKEEKTLLVSNWMDDQLLTIRLKPFSNIL